VYPRPVGERQELISRIEDACSKMKENGNGLQVTSSILISMRDAYK
jgi:hypothetical protein